MGTHPITLARLRWLVANTQRAYVADWSDFTCGCLEHRCAGLPATPAGVGRYLYHLVETDGRMMATAPAHPVANAGCAPSGLTPGPDIEAGSQGHAEAPDQRDPVTDKISLASPVASPEELRAES